MKQSHAMPLVESIAMRDLPARLQWQLRAESCLLCDIGQADALPKSNHEHHSKI